MAVRQETARAERAGATPTPVTADKPLTAALWMVGTLLSFSLMAIAGRELAGYTTFEIMFWRSLVGFAIIACLIAVSARGLRQIRTQRPGLHALRHVAHFFGQNCWFFAVATIPLAQVFAFEFTTPIWVMLLAPFFLGERFTAWRALAAALGFIGVLLVAKPGVQPLEDGHLLGMAAAIGFAINVMATKRLSEHDTALCILFWMTLSQAGMAAVLDLGVDGADALTPPQGGDVIWMAIVGVCGVAAHFCMTNAFRYADATIVSPMDFFRLPLIAVLALVIYAEPIDALVVLGGGLVFLGNFLNLRAERRKKRAVGAA